MEGTTEPEIWGALCKLGPKKKWEGKGAWKAMSSFSQSSVGDKPTQKVASRGDLT